MISTNLILILFVLFNLLLVFYFSKIKFFHINIDKPDKIRKFHSKPTALAGGQIIYLNILIYWIILNLFENLLEKEFFFYNIKSFNFFMIISSSLFLLGFLDDKFNIRANSKFLISIIIISILLLVDNTLVIDNIKFSFVDNNFVLDDIKYFFTIFCFLVFINAFNMFDGINLQSSIYSLFIFFGISIFFLDTIFIKILIISIFGFSYLNFKNQTFLGDSGSLLISFIISYLFIKLYNLNYIEFADEITLFMLIPGLDLIRLFILRILKKRNPLSSDRNHLHHLLIAKYPLNKSLIIILLLIFLPIILSYLHLNNIFVILISTFIYTAFLISLYKKN